MSSDETSFYNISVILSTGGHYVTQQYVPKEISFKTLADEFPFTYFTYNPSPKWKDLSTTDKALNQVLATEGIFDIEYDAYWFGMIRPSSISKLLNVVKPNLPHPDSTYDPPEIVVGYMGGTYEKVLIEQCGMKPFDLKSYGIPEIPELFDQYKDSMDLLHCTHHLDDSTPVCTQVKVQLMDRWVKDQPWNAGFIMESCFFRTHQSKDILNFLDLKRDFITP